MLRMNGRRARGLYPKSHRARSSLCLCVSVVKTFLARSTTETQRQTRGGGARERPTPTLNLMWWAEQEQKSQEALAAIAPSTGGWTEFLEAPEDAEGIYNRILNDINHRYIVGYYSKNKTHDGAQRKIKFQICQHPEYHILARASYYAPNAINPSR